MTKLIGRVKPILYDFFVSVSSLKKLKKEELRRIFDVRDEVCQDL